MEALKLVTMVLELLVQMFIVRLIAQEQSLDGIVSQ
jgi:hypothetical protein